MDQPTLFKTSIQLTPFLVVHRICCKQQNEIIGQNQARIMSSDVRLSFRFIRMLFLLINLNHFAFSKRCVKNNSRIMRVIAVCRSRSIDKISLLLNPLSHSVPLVNVSGQVDKGSDF